MTYEEAWKIIEEQIMAVITGNNTLGKAMEIAIEALEKQIKRKVEFISKKGFEPVKCPVCHYILYNDFYCPHCGQALDWGDEE